MEAKGARARHWRAPHATALAHLVCVGTLNAKASGAGMHQGIFPHTNLILAYIRRGEGPLSHTPHYTIHTLTQAPSLHSTSPLSRLELV
jgi:hypothetical protein